jgi:hypothetical protein
MPNQELTPLFLAVADRGPAGRTPILLSPSEWKVLLVVYLFCRPASTAEVVAVLEQEGLTANMVEALLERLRARQVIVRGADGLWSRSETPLQEHLRPQIANFLATYLPCVPRGVDVLREELAAWLRSF